MADLGLILLTLDNDHRSVEIGNEILEKEK